MEPKSDKELTIEFRNKIAARIIEKQANILYWEKIVKQSKSNSSERMEALKAIQINEADLEKDLVFLICIDELMEGKK